MPIAGNLAVIGKDIDYRASTAEIGRQKCLVDTLLQQGSSIRRRLTGGHGGGIDSRSLYVSRVEGGLSR